ncbi:MAG TPA: hypothetical protein VEA40_26300 [Ramlibacter sp.]|nr:hypothetical protein [Ramlibacter sp.]
MKYTALATVLGALLLAAAPPLAAQTGTAKPAAAAKPAAKAPEKPAPGVNPKLSRSAQKAVEEVTPIDDDPSVTLTDAELDIAKQVYVGEMPCELGASVNVRPARRTGFFVVTTKGFRFLMHPHESRTGAIRLEDPRRGAMWLQLGNKSMLMSQKLGRRLADECQSPQQVTFAEELKRNPRPSILDAPPPRPAQPVQGEPTNPPEAPVVAPAPAAPAATSPQPAPEPAAPAPAAPPAQAQ